MLQLVKDQIQEAEAMHHVWADEAAESEVMPHVLYAQAQEAEVMQHAWADQAAESEVLPHLQYSAARQTKPRSCSMSAPSKPPRRRAIVRTSPRGLLSSTQLTTHRRTTATTWWL